MTNTTKLSQPATAQPSRRDFLRVSAASAGGLVIGTWLPLPGSRRVTLANGRMPADLNAFVRIGTDDSVTVICKHFEMGQGTTTGLATLVAEELDADWSQVAFEFAPNDASIYNNLFFGPVQATGGSTSIANAFEQMRRAGATARAMLVRAAASRWDVPDSEIRVSGGVASNSRDGRRASFGELAEAAAGFSLPEDVRLKSPDEWTLIGSQVSRLDTPGKTTGSAIFALDVRRPGMLRAVVARPPRFGATVAAVDDSATRRIDGVVDVVRIPAGVAVLAQDTWSAIMGKRALEVTWDDAGAETRSTSEIVESYRALAAREGLPALAKGDVDVAQERAARSVEAEFTFPLLAHAPMEPLNCVMQWDGQSADLWSGCQLQTIDTAVIAQVLGVDPSRVRIQTLLAGGSFGRRGNPVADWVVELASIVKEFEGRAPVQLVWTREDDIRGGFYRPIALHRVRAGVTADGVISGWSHRLVSQSIFTGTPFEAMSVHDGVDHSSVEGVVDTPYSIADMSVDVHNAESPVPVLWWRSVGHSHTAFVMETMMDELALAAGADPVEFRLAHLRDQPRGAACLRLAAERGGWGATMPPGSGRGVAYHFSFNTHVAMVADVSVDGSEYTVDRIVAAVDCGVPINPDVIRAQVEGAIGFALSSVLRNEITLTDGVVDQSNFHDYEPTRIREMPAVEVHIIESSESPTGIGEPGVPSIAPAIGNALFAASGTRLRSLPLRLEA